MIQTVDLREKPEPKKEKKQIIEDKEAGIAWNVHYTYYNASGRRLFFIVTTIFVAGFLMLLTENYLFSVFLFLSGIVLALYANKNPENKSIIIDRYGISIGEKHYNYAEIKSFWIEYGLDREKELSLEFKKWYMPYNKLPILGLNPLVIRSWLSKYVPEKEHEKTLIDYFSKKLGL